MADQKDRGLYGKYLVERVDGKPLKGGMCIVLEVGDPNAHEALHIWADTVEADGYVQLAEDVRAQLPDRDGTAVCHTSSEPTPPKQSRDNGSTSEVRP